MNNDVILVTGGSGYIGSHLVPSLVTAGYRVVVFDLMPLYKDNTRYVCGDIRSIQSLNAVFNTYNVRVVVHLAALTSARDTSHQDEYWETNVGGGLTLLEAMIKSGCRHIVFSSSAAVYGRATGSVSEISPTSPVGVYGRSKLEFEKVLQSYARSGHIISTVLRLFNVAGNSSYIPLSSVIDQRSSLMRNAIRSLQPPFSPLELYGADFVTHDGTAVRDYVHVIDVVEAILLVLKRTYSKEDGVTLNIGSAIGTSNKEVIRMIEKVTHKRISVRIANAFNEELIYSVSDINLAKFILKWTPKHSSIKMIVQSMCQHYGVS